MDPLSILAATGQILGACGTTTSAIIQYVNNVRTANERVQGFYHEIVALRSTYGALHDCLKSDILQQAAKAAYQTGDGRRLWDYVSTALHDSNQVVNKVNQVLDGISRARGIMRSPRIVFEESLAQGELKILRERIIYFNNNIGLSVQMVTVMTQQEQRNMTAEVQRTLDNNFRRLEHMIIDLSNRMTHDRDLELRGSTLIVGSVDGSQRMNAENYYSFARRFVTDASAVASTRSASSAIAPEMAHPQRRGVFPQAATDIPVRGSRQNIAEWVAQIDPPGPADQQNSATDSEDSEEDEEMNFRLLQNHLRRAPEAAADGNQEKAENHFRYALGLFAKHDFRGRISLTPAEVLLLLSACCLKQEKFDECISLLEPVATRRPEVFPSSITVSSRLASMYQSDPLQSLAALQLLGEVYLQRRDLDSALKYALEALKKRRKSLGKSDEKTLETVRLVISVYQQMGEPELAEVYEDVLNDDVASSHRSPVHEDIVSEAPTIISLPSPPASDAARPPQPTPESSQRPGRWWSRRTSTNLRDAVGRQNEARPVSGEHRSSPVTGSPGARSPTLHTRPSMTDDRALSNPSEGGDIRSISETAIERTNTASIEPIFETVRNLCRNRKTSKATDIAMHFLEGYSQYLNTFVLRSEALKDNIRKPTSTAKGLAGTGKGYAPIHFFCEVSQECQHEVDLLIKYGADINAGCFKAGFRDGEVFRPLHLAIDRGHTRTALLLVNRPEIDLNVRNGNNHTPLLAACRKGNRELVAALLQKPGAVPRDYPVNWYGNTLLHDAARHCCLPILDLLLARQDCNINARDKFGKTPLMYAIIKTDTSGEEKRRMLRVRNTVVERLLERNADVTLEDDRELTAAAYATIEGDQVLMNMVISRRLERPAAHELAGPEAASVRA